MDGWRLFDKNFCISVVLLCNSFDPCSLRVSLTPILCVFTKEWCELYELRRAISLIPADELFMLLVADAAVLPGTPEPQRRPGGVVSTADRLRVPPPLPQLSDNACHPGPQGLVWLPPGQCHTSGRPVVTRVTDVSEEPAVSSFYIPLICNDCVVWSPQVFSFPTLSTCL